MIRKTRKRAGITKEITPHSFRRAFATRLCQNNINLLKIQNLMGHADSKTTEGYIRINEKDL